jgi:hypothetical protein
MDKEMRQYLEWELNVDPVTLHEFEEMVNVGQGPYPTYILPSSSKLDDDVFPAFLSWRLQHSMRPTSSYSVLTPQEQVLMTYSFLYLLHITCYFGRVPICALSMFYTFCVLL